MEKIKCTVQCRNYNHSDYSYIGQKVVVLAFDGCAAICAYKSADGTISIRNFDIEHLVIDKSEGII